MSVKENLRLMKTLDDAWNSQDWETFKKRHAEKTAVYWPGRPEPTKGRDSHHKEAMEFFRTFPIIALVTTRIWCFLGRVTGPARWLNSLAQ